MAVDLDMAKQERLISVLAEVLADTADVPDDVLVAATATGPDDWELSVGELRGALRALKSDRASRLERGGKA